MNYKNLSLCLGLLVIAFLASIIFNQAIMKRTFHYQNYESLRAKESQSWLPAYIPASATNIQERQNHDSGEFTATFKYAAKDISSIEKVCIKVFEQADRARNL